MRNLTIETVKDLPVHGHAVEIVERKGVGHPDYICDAVMDRVSVALSREYIKRFGRVLHHNIDKGLLSAGSVEKGFNHGKVTKPMEFIIGDRAVFKAGRVSIPVEEIVIDAVGARISRRRCGAKGRCISCPHGLPGFSRRRPLCPWAC